MRQALHVEHARCVLLSSTGKDCCIREDCPLLHCASYGFGFIHRLDVASSGLVLAATTFQGLLWLHLGRRHLEHNCTRPSSYRPAKAISEGCQSHRSSLGTFRHLVLCLPCFYSGGKCLRRVYCPLPWVGPQARTRDRRGCHRPRMAKGVQDCHPLDGKIGRDFLERQGGT